MSNIGIGTDADMQVTASDNTICVVCKDIGNPGGSSGIMWATSDGTGFTNGYSNFNTTGCPAVVFFGGLFWAYSKDPGGGGILQQWSNDGQSWQGNKYIGFNTSGGCSAVSFQNQVWLFYRDSSNSLIDYAAFVPSKD